jgi:hypothetical protein
MPNVVPHVPDPDAIPPILFYIAAGVAGGVVGIGFMITYLATWGRKLFSGEKGDPGDQGNRGDRGMQGTPGDQGDAGQQGATGRQGVSSCPYASEHPKLLAFMGESTQDRRDLRQDVQVLFGKVDETSKVVIKCDAKLDLILKSAKIKFNGG